MVKNLIANAGNTGSIPGSRRFPGEGSGNALQYSSLGNPMNRGVWWATVHVVAKSRTRLVLKLKLQYVGHPMRKADSFEKTLMLGKTEGRRRRG